MDKQQKFQPGDKVKVTMELTVVGVGPGFDEDGTVGLMVLSRWAGVDHIDVELIDRPKPPREPGWYLCTYGDAPCAMRWDGADWRWPSGDGIRLQDTVVVLGAVTLNEGVEL